MEKYNLRRTKGIIRESGAGFTLIELVVVLGLFAMIMVATVTMFVSIVRHQKAILFRQELVNQASFAKEHISKLLRAAVTDTDDRCLAKDGAGQEGNIFLLTRPDQESGFYQGIKFTTGDHSCFEIFADKDGVLKEIQNNGPAHELLSSKFSLGYARFIINGNKDVGEVSAGGGTQPRVTFVLNIKNPAYSDSPNTIIQTTISHR